ncbi:hypothetical protein BGZ49_009958 [Haplosporangium sp. Z 27]|nr:hypothetical protein BGZ49_009958 [Haplosporangium sp. Z 27]
MSSTNASNSEQPPHTTETPAQDTQPEENKPVLTLPAPGDVSSTNQLEVNGKDLKLDILGPVVVNEDGTMSRIDNWHEMADIEKDNVRRILLKRNAKRLEKLKAENQSQE